MEPYVKANGEDEFCKAVLSSPDSHDTPSDTFMPITHTHTHTHFQPKLVFFELLKDKVYTEMSPFSRHFAIFPWSVTKLL